MCGIYFISINNNSHFYVGQSVDIKKRWQDHLAALRNNHHRNEILQRCFNKYGEDAFQFDIICECEKEKLNELEQYFIFELNAFAYDYPEYGCNLTKGGDGCRGTIWTEEQIEKRRQGIIEYYNHPENRLAARERTLKQFEDEEFYNSYLILRRSEEFRKKESEAHKGIPVSEEAKKKLSEALGQKVLCVELNLEFCSANEAERYILKTFGKHINVKAVISGSRKTAAGFHWIRIE